MCGVRGATKWQIMSAWLSETRRSVLGIFEIHAFAHCRRVRAGHCAAARLNSLPPRVATCNRINTWCRQDKPTPCCPPTYGPYPTLRRARRLVGAQPRRGGCSQAGQGARHVWRHGACRRRAAPASGGEALSASAFLRLNSMSPKR